MRSVLASMVRPPHDTPPRAANPHAGKGPRPGQKMQVFPHEGNLDEIHDLQGTPR